jgi:hypothetical protein
MDLSPDRDRSNPDVGIFFLFVPLDFNSTRRIIRTLGYSALTIGSIRSRRWTGEERESDSQGITSSSLSTSFQLSVYSLLVISFPPLPWLRIIANSLNHPSSPPLVSSVEPNRPCLSWSAHCTDPELNQFSVSSLLFYYETDVSTRCTRMKRRY